MVFVVYHECAKKLLGDAVLSAAYLIRMLLQVIDFKTPLEKLTYSTNYAIPPRECLVVLVLCMITEGLVRSLIHKEGINGIILHQGSCIFSSMWLSKSMNLTINHQLVRGWIYTRMKRKTLMLRTSLTCTYVDLWTRRWCEAKKKADVEYERERELKITLVKGEKEKDGVDDGEWQVYI